MPWARTGCTILHASQHSAGEGVVSDALLGRWEPLRLARCALQFPTCTPAGGNQGAAYIYTHGKWEEGSAITSFERYNMLSVEGLGSNLTQTLSLTLIAPGWSKTAGLRGPGQSRRRPRRRRRRRRHCSGHCCARHSCIRYLICPGKVTCCTWAAAQHLYCLLQYARNSTVRQMSRALMDQYMNPCDSYAAYMATHAT